MQPAQFSKKYNLIICLCFIAVSWQTQFHLLTSSIHYNGFFFKKVEFILLCVQCSKTPLIKQ